MQMEILGAVQKAIWEFWTWIAQGFWPGIGILLITLVIGHIQARRDRAQVNERVHRREYTDWRKSYISGELTGSVPTDADIHRNLRWFLTRKDDKPEKVILSNRSDTAARTVRVRLATSPQKVSRRWKIGTGKTMRFKIGRIPDRCIEGVRLDIYWDDDKGPAQHATFIIPHSEFELPLPEVGGSKASSGSGEPAGPTPKTSEPEAQKAAALASPPLPAPSPAIDPAPPLTRSRKDALRTIGSHVLHETQEEKVASGFGAVNGISPSTNIADRTIPNRTPSLPANFEFVKRDDQLGLKNLGPGDASHVYLQPMDDAHSITDGGFWPSIPAHTVQPFALSNNGDVGVFKIRFELTWDDGYMLGREKPMNIPGIGD